MKSGQVGRGAVATYCRKRIDLVVVGTRGRITPDESRDGTTKYAFASCQGEAFRRLADAPLRRPSNERLTLLIRRLFIRRPGLIVVRRLLLVLEPLLLLGVLLLQLLRLLLVLLLGLQRSRFICLLLC